MSEFDQLPKFRDSRLYSFAVVAFLVCFVAMFFTRSTMLFAFMGISVGIGAVARSLSKSQHRKSLAEFRENNAKLYPRIFSSPAPTNFAAIEGDEVDLYDLETGLYIGRTSKSDIQTIFDAFDNDSLVFENGDNDIPFTQDFIQSIEESDEYNLSSGFLRLMDIAMDSRFLTLITMRWVQPK